MFSIIADRGFLRRARVNALAGGRGSPDASTDGVSVAGLLRERPAEGRATGWAGVGLGLESPSYDESHEGRTRGAEKPQGQNSGWKARATMSEH